MRIRATYDFYCVIIYRVLAKNVFHRKCRQLQESVVAITAVVFTCCGMHRFCCIKA
jgi:hypothetical protein